VRDHLADREDEIVFLAENLAGIGSIASTESLTGIKNFNKWV
jgi:hypothetical protein